MKTKKAIFLGVMLVLMVSLMLPLGCAKEAETPTPTEFKTYSKYGFSFEYPKKFPVTEIGLLENEANDNSGIVQVALENEELKLFQVSYIKTVMWDIEGSLAGGFQGMEGAQGIASVETGELVETTKAGHRMLYQYYTVTSTEGDKIYGILASFYCDKSQKAFVPMTMNNTISAKQDVLEDFMNYLDSFVCH